LVRICVSIPTTTTATTIGVMRDLAEPDLIELRLDYATERLDLQRLRDSTPIPLIATARVPSHGGRWGSGEAERLRLLLSAVNAGFDYIDAESESDFLGKLVGESHKGGASVIVSSHNLDRMPSLQEILATSREAKGAGADLVKIVGMALSPSDNLPCLEYLAREPGNVCFAMGALGVPSRVLSPLMGGAFTYASAGKGGGVAPGQPTLSSLREVYHLMGVTS